MKKWSIAIILSVGLFLTAMTAAASTPTEFVRAKTNEAKTILAKPDSPARAQELQRLVNSAVDFRELASRSLGAHWRERSDTEQQEFLDLLHRLLQASYTERLEGQRLGQDYTIEYRDERVRNDRAVVRTDVRYQDDQRPVVYRLLRRNDSWMIYDIVIDDVSLEETYRDGYTPIIEDEGWQSLITRMRDRLAELEKR